MTELVPGLRARVAGWLTRAADLILLHLCFMVASLAVVTVVPAALALQRSMDDMLLRQDTAIVGTFWPHFRWAVRRFTVVSLLVLAYALLVVASIFLWSSFDGIVQGVGVGTVLALGALCTGLYVSGLAWVGTSSWRPEPGGADEEEREAENWRSLWNGARDRFAAQPVPVLACVVVLFGWLLMLAWVPPLGLFGFGLVPALLAYWLNRVAPAPQRA